MLISGLYHGRQMLESKLSALSSSCKQKKSASTEADYKIHIKNLVYLQHNSNNIK